LSAAVLLRAIHSISGLDESERTGVLVI